jgi:hypothetical protein
VVGRQERWGSLMAGRCHGDGWLPDALAVMTMPTTTNMQLNVRPNYN